MLKRPLVVRGRFYWGHHSDELSLSVYVEAAQPHSHKLKPHGTVIWMHW